MGTSQLIQTFLLGQILGLCVYKLSDQLGPWAISFGVLTAPATFVVVQCAWWSHAQAAGTAPDSLEELLRSFFWAAALVIGVIVNLSGSVVTIFLAHKLAPVLPPRPLEK